MSNINIEDVKTWLQTATLSELDMLRDLTSIRRQSLGLQTALTLKPGDKVFFDGGSKGIIRGTFVKLNQKNAVVSADTGINWRVSPVLLKKDSGN